MIMFTNNMFTCGMYAAQSFSKAVQHTSAACGQLCTVTSSLTAPMSICIRAYVRLSVCLCALCVSCKQPCDQYVMDELLHIRLVCWPVRTAFTCSIRVMDLFPWDGSSQLKRFGHICWESELFLFCGAWWRIVVFPKGW